MSTSYRTTLPALLLENIEEYGNRTALREKQWGVWQSVSWADYGRHTAEFAAGLNSLGLGKDDVVVCIGDNRPEWLWAELAIQSLGGISLGLYQDAPADEVAYIFDLAQVKLVVAEDQEQVDKMLEIREQASHLKYIIYHDPRGMAAYEVDDLMSFEDVCAMGKDRAGEFPEWVKALSPDDTCLIATTSGTTGRPKLAMLSHANMLSMAANLGAADPKFPKDEFVSFLPLAWMGEQMMALASALLFGFTVNFPEEPDTVQGDIREIGPHLIFSPPRVWENMAAGVQVKIMETTPFKRGLYNILQPIGLQWADAQFQKRTPSLGLKCKYFLAKQLLFIWSR